MLRLRVNNKGIKFYTKDLYQEGYGGWTNVCLKDHHGKELWGFEGATDEQLEIMEDINKLLLKLQYEEVE